MKPILAAVDNSHYADLVMRQAADLALLLSSDLVVLSVLNPDPMRNNTLAEAEAQLKDFQKGLIHRHFADEVTKESETADAVQYKHRRTRILLILAHGNPADKICEYAAKYDASLVLVGNRGLGNIGTAILGSVSERVVRKCPTSVMVVKSAGPNNTGWGAGASKHVVRSH